MAVFERRLYEKGYLRIAGVDEAGRGPLAGPVVAAACILPPAFLLKNLNDSKQLTPEKREELFSQMKNDPRISFGVGIVSVEQIDAINILQATLVAMRIAVQNLPHPPDFVLIDGNQLPRLTIPMEAIVQGDAFSISIAAASVFVKVTRDRIMIEEAKKWPQYGFGQHKGYGVPQHLAALRKYGPCPIHRKSFAPVLDSLALFSYTELSP